MGEDALRLCLFGAPLDTGNRGVEALGRSVLAGVARSTSAGAVTVFDNGWGVRPVASETAGLAVELCGVRGSRRVWRRESWVNVRVSQRLGGLRSPVAGRLRTCHAVLDITGGDSFTDLYGRSRLHTVSAPKLAAARAGRPLVLLPQTYGPFTHPSARRLARRVVRSAGLAWSRDADSHAVLLELLGEHGGRARQGVDVAFALPAHPPPEHALAGLAELLEQPARGRAPLVGVNVSGLLWSDPLPFGLTLDYRATVLRLVERLLELDCTVVLVPHVRDVAHGREDDATAARQVAGLVAHLAADGGGRVHVLSDELSASQAKWVIGRLDWFVGSRMHATVAALSSGVPAAALAYSAKTRGVFASCGAQDAVVDARSAGTDEAVERLVSEFGRREHSAGSLHRAVPAVLERARDQLRETCEWVRAGAERTPA